MATIVTKSIGTSSRDYSTLQSWEDACPANLVTADQVWKGECYNDSEFAVAGPILAISGQTTDATRYVWLTTAAGQSFTDNANKLTNALRYNQANGVAARMTAGFLTNCTDFQANYTVIENMQFAMDYASANNTGTIYFSGTGQTIRNCIVAQLSTGVNNCVIINLDSATSCVAINCVGHSVATSYPGNGTLTGNNSVIACTMIHLTGASGRKAYFRGYGTPTVQDCIGFGYGDFARDTTGTGGYNASDIASPAFPGGVSATNKTGLTPSSELTSVSTTTPDLRVKTGATVISAGTRLNAYTNDQDIIYSTRSTTAPTIGAWEFVSSGISGTLARTLSNDILAASGTTTILATLARTLNNDTLASSTTTTIVGTLAKTLSNDILVASGSIGTSITGTLVKTLLNDTLSASGTTTILSTLTRTLNNDILTANGNTTILSTLNKTLANDIMSAFGTSGTASATSLWRTLTNAGQ